MMKIKYIETVETNFVNARSLLTWNKFYLSCLGLWPKLNKFLFLTQYYSYTYHWLADFLAFYMTLSSHNLMKIIGTGMECISLTQVWVRYYMFKNYHKDFETLLRDFEKDYSIKNYKTEEEKKIFLHYNSVSKKFIFVVIVALYCTGCNYVSGPLTRQINFSKNNNATFIYELPYKMYDWYKITNAKVYFVTYLSRFVLFFIPVMIIQSCMDCVSITIISHLCGQLGVLSCRIRNICPTNESAELKKFLKKHQELIEIGLRLRDVYKLCLLTHFIGATTGIGILIYQLLVVEYCTYASMNKMQKTNLALFLFYAFLHIFRFYIFCWAGQCLITESVNVSDAYYESKWYEMSIENKKLILYGIHRSQKPLVLTGATSKCYSLEIFAKVMKSALAYLSFLRKFI